MSSFRLNDKFVKCRNQRVNALTLVTTKCYVIVTAKLIQSKFEKRNEVNRLFSPKQRFSCILYRNIECGLLSINDDYTIYMSTAGRDRGIHS